MAGNGGVINRQLLPNQLSKEIDNMFDSTVLKTEKEFPKYASVISAPKTGNRTTSSEIAGFGLPGEVPEGASVNYDTPEEGFTKVRDYTQYGLGFAITDLMLKDEEFGRIKAMSPKMARSMNIFTEMLAIKPFNEGETATNGDWAKSKDGLALFGTHALLDDRTGNYGSGVANEAASAADLSETTLVEAFQYFDSIVDENGYPMYLRPKLLVVGEEDRYVAYRLKNQMFGSSYNIFGATPASATTGDSNLNLNNPENGAVDAWDIHVSRYLDTDRWFMCSDQNAFDRKGYTVEWKEQPWMHRYKDDDTLNVVNTARMRLSVYADEWRGLWGNIQ